MSKFLYDVSGGDGPYDSPCVSVQTNASASNLVAAPGVGKRIIPVWLMLWGEKINALGGVGTSVGVYGASAEYAEYLIIMSKFYISDQVAGYRHTEPFFMNFGLGHYNTIGENQALRLGIITMLAENWAKIWAKCGYYIIGT